MNCEQMSASSRGAISVEACKQMMAAQQPLTPPDKAKVAEAQAATDDFRVRLNQNGSRKSRRNRTNA